MKIKVKRNYLLEKTDFTVLPDSPYTELEKSNIKIYRQALRDMVDIFPIPPVCISIYIKSLVHES